MTARRTILLLLFLSAGICCAQFLPRRGSRPGVGKTGNFVRIEGGLVVDEDTVRSARETDTHSTGTPEWTNSPGFETDVFTFIFFFLKSDPPRDFHSSPTWRPPG